METFHPPQLRADHQPLRAQVQVPPPQPDGDHHRAGPGHSGCFGV